MKTKLTILTFLLLNILTYSEIRYVSPQGSNTIPFISWATASRTIQGCIDVSSPGDTIYVGNGVYKEVVTMISKLALIGSGIDSCMINSRDFAQPSNFYAVYLEDSCYIRGFRINVSKERWGVGVVTNFYNEINNVLIENMNLTNAYYGVNIPKGSSIIRNCTFNNVVRCISLNVPESEYQQQIYNNIFTEFSGAAIGINVGANGIIRNNVFYLDSKFDSGFFMSQTYGLEITSNIIISEIGLYGIDNSFYQPIKNHNNVIIGKFAEYSILTGEGNDVKNNVVINGTKGIAVQPGHFPTIKYNNVWNNTKNYINFTPDSTNLSVDPMFVNEDSLDFRLQMFSPLIDAGDPEILDKDGSRSDIGLFGGPYGESYKYQDYAPKPPKNLTAEMNENEVILNWLYNTEADFSHYRVYRDTVPNFIYDTTKIIAEVKDTTIYKDKIRTGRNVYYKITAMDNQGNQSAASEEVSIISVGVEKPKLIANDYKLFQNYPNPFNPSTMISYRLKENSRVRIVLYSTTGEKVEELVNKHQAKGYYEINYNARKRGLSSGIYILRMEVKDENNIPRYTDAVKMILVK